MFQNPGGATDFGGGFGGGGFSAGGFSSPAGDKPRKFRYQNITPITASHVEEMTFDDSVFRLGDHEITQVTIVGTVVQVEKTQTCITYQIDDTTGTVTAKHWVSFDAEEDPTGDDSTVFEEGTVVRVFAQVRSFQKTVTLNTLHIRAVQDLNEITVHMLECIKFKLLNEANKKKAQLGNTSSMSGFQGHGFGNQSSAANHGMDAVQTQVWQLVESCDAPEGVSIDQIRSSLKGLNVHQIKKALDFLSNEGHIYSTIDEDHFRSTS